eukprot:CAMPEP_0201148806 /NCGR_PEP_ID=MMETSP0851-20130426/10216_1 /ASSEMBLY_ACC=CAM_ASM_000631 /TAXON_ID=183588 /ORGANISM="Pseudo-nitzschia fraudulenta, Strain WWA7" /LENGTH=997 /DNA_ID=CAMNT_0047425067 /DNA_START=33 /DNA_END=3026 /DNA_ORIENTATION=+
MADTAVATDGTHVSLEAEMNSLLSSPSFSVASYLNLALSSSSLPATAASATSSVTTGGYPDADGLQRKMTELALQLQIQTQSCHEDIGRIGAELQAILPRCAADVGRVGVGLDGMQADAAALLEATGSGGEREELSTSLETLSTLHALRANLSGTREVLKAAATWDSTIGSVAPLLAEQNLSEAVHALARLEAGEKALRGMPHKEERRQSIAEIREQVQALLQPQLRHALQNMHTRLAPLQQCVVLYSKLGKTDTLREDYVKQRPGAVHKAWFSYAPPHRALYGNVGGGATDGGATTSSKTSNNTEGPGAATNPPMSSSEQVAAAQLAGDSFLAWLPTWYETVLNLVTEERRQASTVFGPAEAPDVMIRVLREAFRPILPSFQSRLEMVFSVAVSTGNRGGSFETICALYEATLRFLSLVYDLVAGSFLDLVESGASKKGDTGLGLYLSMRDVFLQLASPFALYAQRFADLEEKHSHVAAGMVSKDIQQTVVSVSSSSSMNLQALQDAMGRLNDLASFIFPIVDGSLDRFELLNGGYRVRDALGSVDTILSDHLGELVIAVRSLSAAMTADAHQLVLDFDEQHVLCAMEVLKMAGNFRRDLRNFEGGTRARMKSLSERMEDYLAREASFDAIVETPSSAAAAASTSGKSSKKSSSMPPSHSFSMPDALSVVEIDSYLTRVFCGDGGNGNSSTEGTITTGTDTERDGEDIHPSLATLQTIGSGTSPRDESSIYSQTEVAIQNLATSCHSFVFDVCSAVPSKHLNDLSDMPAWRENASASGDLDSYGTLPQQYITQVGEHMLSLVQAFEPFASDSAALSLVNEAMDGVRDVALQPWSDFVAAAGFVGSETVVVALMDGSEEIGSLLLSNAALSEEDAALEDGATEEEIASAAFCNAWLDVIGLAVTGKLLEKTMRIPQLTTKGCEHLAADLGYLVNVFSALGVAGHPHPLVSHLGTLSTLSDADLEAHVRSRDTKASEAESALRAVEARIALRRGISIG